MSCEQVARARHIRPQSEPNPRLRPPPVFWRAGRRGARGGGGDIAKVGVQVGEVEGGQVGEVEVGVEAGDDGIGAAAGGQHGGHVEMGVDDLEMLNFDAAEGEEPGVEAEGEAGGGEKGLVETGVVEGEVAQEHTAGRIEAGLAKAGVEAAGGQALLDGAKEEGRHGKLAGEGDADLEDEGNAEEEPKGP